MHGIIKYQQIKNLNLTASVRNRIMGHGWIRTMIQSKHQNQHKNVSLCTKWSFWPSKFPALNTIGNERGELKRRSTNMELWIWRIWRFCVKEWSLISCQVFSNLFRLYARMLLYWEKNVALIGCQLLWPMWAREKLLFHNEISPPPTFNCFTSMKGYKCGVIKKSKR